MSFKKLRWRANIVPLAYWSINKERLMEQDLVFFSGFLFTSVITDGTSILSGTFSEGFSTWLSQDAHAGLPDGFHVKILTHTEMH